MTGWVFLSLIIFLLFNCNYAMADDPVCDLSQAADAQLQSQLDNLLKREQLSAAARHGELALTLLVLSDPEKPRLAQVNGNRMMYAASLPKIVILLGAAVAIDEGRLQVDDGLLEDLHLMIRKSCNPCANRMIERVGEKQLLDLVQSPRFGFYDANDGGLWLGKQYGRKPAWRREPLRKLSHAATTFQTARFYCGLQKGTLVSPEQTQLMLDTLSDPGIDHKFVKGLKSQENIEVFRKSGTWKFYHADSALVRSGDDVYVIVGLTNHPEGGAWLQRLASPMHELAVAKPGAD